MWTGKRIVALFCSFLFGIVLGGLLIFEIIQSQTNNVFIDYGLSSNGPVLVWKDVKGNSRYVYLYTDAGYKNAMRAWNIKMMEWENEESKDTEDKE
jgi:hypothetical protein